MLFRCGGISKNDYCKFTNEFISARILLVGQHLAKLSFWFAVYIAFTLHQVVTYQLQIHTKVKSLPVCVITLHCFCLRVPTTLLSDISDSVTAHATFCFRHRQHQAAATGTLCTTLQTPNLIICHVMSTFTTLSYQSCNSVHKHDASNYNEVNHVQHGTFTSVPHDFTAHYKKR